jgi:predicted transcriptional regulator
MAFEGYSKKRSEIDALNILHKNILRVMQKLQKKRRVFSIPTLFNLCCKDLPNPEPEIERAIRDLIRMKYIVEGQILNKEDILTNENRHRIYEYILKNPGAHEREIRRIFGLGAYMSYRHTNYLVIFGFLRKREYQNKFVYFPIDSDATQDIKILLLRDETTQSIYDCLQDHQALRLPEMEELLQIPYTTIRFHIKRLLEANLISKTKRDLAWYYEVAERPPQEALVEIKRAFDYIGGMIRFKVAVRNLTEMAIHNIVVSLNASTQFVSDIKHQEVANLPPNTTRGLDFILTPITCGRSKIFGSVTFEDAFGAAHSIPIAHKEISIKCPLVQPKTATQTDVDEWIKNLKRGTSSVNYHHISDTEAFRIGREQVSALDLNEIIVNTEENWGIYSGEIKVSGDDMVIKIGISNSLIVLDVWAPDLKQTTGFLAYISNLINLALETTSKIAQKTTDIGQKIACLFEAGAILDKTLTLCENLGAVSEVSTCLFDIRRLLDDAFIDIPFFESLNEILSDLKGTQEPRTPITRQTAIKLTYQLLGWLNKIRELTKFQITTYQESFEDLTQVTNDFTEGIHQLETRMTKHEKIYGQFILSYLLILEKTSGITIFEKDLGDLRINPDLVGGFLHALQSFGREISSTDSSMQTLTYEDYKFQIDTGKQVRVALILLGTPNQFVITQLKTFVHQFEQNFEEAITHFTGSMDPFKPASALFSAIFGLKSNKFK